MNIEISEIKCLGIINTRIMNINWWRTLSSTCLMYPIIKRQLAAAHAMHRSVNQRRGRVLPFFRMRASYEGSASLLLPCTYLPFRPDKFPSSKHTRVNIITFAYCAYVEQKSHPAIKFEYIGINSKSFPL